MLNVAAPKDHSRLACPPPRAALIDLPYGDAEDR
jgi:hypothetical protein